MPLAFVVLGACVATMPAYAQSWTPSGLLNSNGATDAIEQEDRDVRVATDGAGAWVAVWSATASAEQGGDNEVFVSHSSGSTIVWSSPIPLNTNALTDTAFDEKPEIATDAKGNWVVVWSSNPPETGSDGDIFVAHSSNNGATWSAPTLANSYGADDFQIDSAPHIVSDGRGTWMIAWETIDNNARKLQSKGVAKDLDSDIMWSQSPDNGATWAPAQLVNASGDLDEDTHPRLATDGAGNYLIVWELVQADGELGSDGDIVSARLGSGAGGPAWTSLVPVNSLAITDGTRSDVLPRIATDGRGAWIVTWQSQDSSAGANADIYAGFSQDNGLTWSPTSDITGASGSDTAIDEAPDVASDSQGNFIVAWGASRNLGADDYDIFFSRGSIQGLRLAWSGASLVNNNGDADAARDSSPVVATDRKGTWLTAWSIVDAEDGPLGADGDLLYSTILPTGSLRGSVTVQDSESRLSCAAVIVRSIELQVERVVTVDLTGAFVMPNLPAGAYSAEVFAPGFTSNISQVTISAGQESLAKLGVAAATDIPQIFGQITDSVSSNALAGARVQVALLGGTPVVTYTCADGRYEIRGLVAKPGSALEFECESEGYEDEAEEIEIELEDSTEVNKALAPKSIGNTGVLAGVVRDANTSDPIPNARVTVSGIMNTTADTDVDGQYVFPSLPEGQYAAHASATYYQPADLDAIVNALLIDPIDIELTGLGGSASGDIDGNQSIDAVDVQLVINAALGLTTGFDCDIDADGFVTAVDVQLVINAALQR